MDTLLLRDDTGGAVAAGASPSESRRRRPLVLIVDDDGNLRSLLALILEMEGYSTVCAADGVDAMAVVEWILPEAIVTDVHMPQLSGAGLCRQVRASPRTASIPIVVFSAQEYGADIAEIEALGDVGYADKADGCQSLLAVLSTRLAESDRAPVAD